MKKFHFNWVRTIRLALLWITYLLLINYGLFWVPWNGITLGTYQITVEIISHSLFALLIAKTFNVIMRNLFWDFLIAKILNGLAPYLLIQITSMLSYFIAVLIIVGLIFGQSIAGFITMFGALGVVIGLGVQRLVLDAFSGVTINIDSPFSLGDFIQIQVANKIYFGQVVGISWRLTTLMTSENNKVSIPNSLISGNPVFNFSKPSTISEFEQIYYFPHSYSEMHIQRILMNAVKSIEMMGNILEKSGKVRITEIKPECIGYKVKYEFDAAKIGPGKVRHALHAAVIKHVRSSGFEFYDPTQRVMFSGEKVKKHTFMDLLKTIPLFNVLTEEQMLRISAYFKKIQFTPKTEIVVNGDTSASMYIIEEGFATVRVPVEEGEKIVATLNPGDFFGEMALLTGEPRNATIISESDAVVYEITKDDILPLLSENPELFEAFATIIAKRKMENEKSLDDYAKNKERKKDLVDHYMKKIKSFFIG